MSRRKIEATPLYMSAISMGEPLIPVCASTPASGEANHHGTHMCVPSASLPHQ